MLAGKWFVTIELRPRIWPFSKHSTKLVPERLMLGYSIWVRYRP